MEDSEIHELTVEIRLIRAELKHMSEAAKERALVEAEAARIRQATDLELFDRMRALEQGLAVLQSAKPARVNGWTITAVVISALVALITFINEVSVPAG